ncbi:MAG: hypothetical protein ACLVD8_15815 [Enterocloster sp.]|uniref:hypothetical protein n=1 Tax=Enterocloster sp. TaxID=2719315 RepID=UPI00399B1697
MPAKLYIQDERVSENAPDKILREKAPDNSLLDSLHYDNTSPRDSDGNELLYDNKKHDLNSAQYQHHEEMRKKQQIIRDIQEYWDKQKKPRLKNITETFGISLLTAKRYLAMTQECFLVWTIPIIIKNGNHPVNVWLNVIYKMMADGYSNELIYFYIKRQKVFHESEHILADYIYLIGKNNFSRQNPV